MTPARLHVLTDETMQQRFSHAELARLAVEGGADAIQFREKREHDTRDLIATASEMAEIVEGRAQLLVDDRVDVAIAVGADGVHLGRHDIDAATARRLMGDTALIGGTANSLEEAVRVSSSPVDYLGVGPVFGTRSKTNPAPVLGLATLAKIVAMVDKPIIAIGSITAARVAEVLGTGAHGVAVLSEVVLAGDVREATARLREAVDGYRASRRRSVEVER